MPLYDFKCRQCGHEFELLVMSGEMPRCPRCASEALSKLMSGFSVGGGTAARAGSGGGKCSGCAGGSCSSCH